MRRFHCQVPAWMRTNNPHEERPGDFLNSPLKGDLDRIRKLVGLAYFRSWRFDAIIANLGRPDASIRLVVSGHGGMGDIGSDAWAIPADAGYDEAREVTLRAVLELIGEEARAEYRYRGEPAPGTRK